MPRLMIICLGLIAATVSLEASDKDAAITFALRADYWKYLREQKANALVEEKPGKLEKALFAVKERHIMERFQAGVFGFHPLLGGLETGSGFALGTEYRRALTSEGSVEMKARAQASFKGYQRYELGIAAPHVAGDKLFFSLDARQSNSPRLPFFGIGGDSQESDRSNYRYDATDVRGTAGFRAAKWLEIGTTAGMLNSNSEAGRDNRWPSVEEVFSSEDVPGLAEQPQYHYAGVFVRADTRDEPGNPRSGRMVELNWNGYQDRDHRGYSFKRVDAEVQQYIPFFNKRRVIALRGRTVLSDTGAGNAVPFFLQPTLGGSEDLRGFREFRFRDRNLMVMNAEYRWEAFSGLDLALFADAGKVFHSSRQLNFSDLEKSYGFGFRFNTAKSVFWRIDTAFGNEGPRVFLKFGHVF
jgi:outer membrane protein assembly factor BamA